MAQSRHPWYSISRQIRHIPDDLTIVLAFVALTNVAVLVPVVRTTPLRVPLGLALVLFVPGYAFTAALFPQQAESREECSLDTDGDNGSLPVSRNGISDLGRIAVSVGMSIAVVALVALVSNFTPWGINLLPIVTTVSVLTVIATLVAVNRRLALPADERFSVPHRRWVDETRTALFESNSSADAVFTLFLVLGLLVAASSVAYAITAPDADESFTEFYLLTENEDGELVASGYPQNVTADELPSLVVGIQNNENHPQRYTVIAELQRSNAVRTRTPDTAELLRTQTGVLSNDETWRYRHDVNTTITGNRLHLTYMLYRGDAPSNPTAENAYRELHLWLNVTGT